MKTKILPVLLAVAFILSALVVTPDYSEAASDNVVIDGNTLTDDYDAPSGEWRYVWDTNTLYMNGAKMIRIHDGDTSRHISSVIYCLRTDKPLTIVLDGENMIQEQSSSEWYDYENCSIYSEGGLIITGDGSLFFDTPLWDRGIHVKGDVQFTGNAWVEIYTSGAAVRVEGDESSLLIDGGSVLVTEKQIEVLGSGGVTIREATVTFCMYLGFFDLGNSDKNISGKLVIDSTGAGGKIRRTDQIWDEERSRPIVKCWNYEGPSRYDMPGATMNNATLKPVEDNLEYLVSTDISKYSFVGYFNSTITYDANGGTCTTASDVTLPTGQLASLPDASETTRPGYELAGWFNQAEGPDSVPITLDYFFSEDSTVYAQWNAIPVKVTFNTAGGVCDIDWEMTNSKGNLDTIPDATRDDWIFAGWYTEPDGGGERVTKSTMFLNDDVTVYAYWVHDVYVILFGGNGGDPDVPFEITTTGKLTKLPGATWEKHMFVGWYTQAEGGDRVTTDTEFHDNVTIYAHWVDQYKVTFDPKGGYCDTDYAYTNAEVKIDPMPVTKRIGNHFIGWFTSAEGGEKVTSDTAIGSDMTLYAHWVRIYWVSFDANGGECDTTIEQTNLESKLDTIPTPTRDGYIFQGWFTQEHGGTKITTSSEIDHNMKVYAHWKEGTGDFVKDNIIGLGSLGVILIEALLIMAVAFIAVRRK